jgi:hypothetical protein
MKPEEAIQKMIPPGQRRPRKFMGGVIQIWLTRKCDKSCFGCTQGSNIRGASESITLENFEKAVLSLKNYWGVVGIFGGNPCLHPQFGEICEILRKHIPQARCGLWANKLFGNGVHCAKTFNPAVSNLNVHLDRAAYDEFRRTWPRAKPFGLDGDCRHSPPYAAIQDLIEDKGDMWQLISDCDINKHWSSMICQFRGEARAYFCEIAGAQAMLYQNDPEYPHTGIPIACECDGRKAIEITTTANKEFRTYAPCACTYEGEWWEQPIETFSDQIKKHCPECGVPLRIHGTLSQEGSDGVEIVTKTHEAIFKPKKPKRIVFTAKDITEVEAQGIDLFTDYVGNAKR